MIRDDQTSIGEKSGPEELLLMSPMLKNILKNSEKMVTEMKKKKFFGYRGPIGRAKTKTYG